MPKLARVRSLAALQAGSAWTLIAGIVKGIVNGIVKGTERKERNKIGGTGRGDLYCGAELARTATAKAWMASSHHQVSQAASSAPINRRSAPPPPECPMHHSLEALTRSRPQGDAADMEVQP